MADSNLLRQSGAFEQLGQFAEGGFLYAISDAAGEPLLAAMLRELGPSRTVPLIIPGVAQQELVPYVFAVNSLLLSWLRETVWLHPWGVFVLAKSDLASLCHHFVRFLLVSLPDGDQWFFRYYDPRVLANYLPNCSQEELLAFYGPVRAFVITDPDTGQFELMQMAQPSPQTATTEPPSAPAPLAPAQDATEVWGIRPEQVIAVQPAAVQSFESRVAAHLLQFFPEQCNRLGEMGLREAIDYGIHRAEAHAIVLEHNVCTYIDLMFTFGLNFDTEMPWAAAILNDATLSDASLRTERLFEAARQHVQTALAQAAT